MKYLERVINVLLLAALAAVVLAGVWVWRERTRLYADLKAQIEQQAAQAIGLPVEIGTIRGQVWKRLVVEDVRIRGHAGPGAPVVVRVRRVEANYSIPEVLRLGKTPVQIQVVGPVVTLERDAAGAFNVRPAPRPSAEPPEPSKVPVRVVVRDAAVEWTDRYQATSSQVVPFRRRIPLQAEIELRRETASYTAQLSDANAAILVRGRHDLVKGTGDASLRVTGLGLPDWAAYAASSDDYRILAGTADAVAAITYDAAHSDRLSLGGQAWIRGVTLEHKDLLAPVENVDVEAAFDRSAVRIGRLSATLLGNRITGQGRVDIRNPEDPGLDLALTMPRVDLASLQPIVPEIAPFGVSGQAGATVRILGTSLDPLVEIAARVDRAVAMKETLGPGRASVRFHRLEADVRDIDVAVHGGRLTGDFWFTTDARPVAGGRLAFEGVDVGPAAAPYLPRPLPLKGKASGTVDVSGPMEAIRITGVAQLRDAGIGRQAIEAGRADFAMQRGNVTVSDIVLSAPDGGRVTGDLGWDDAGDLVAALAGQDIDLAALRKVGLDVDVAGRADLTFDAAGNMLAPDTLEFGGRLAVRGAMAYGQPIEALAATYRLADGRLALSEVVGSAAGARVVGSGLVAPVSFERELPPPDVRFDFDVEGADLGRMPAIAEAATHPLGGLSGQVDARGVELRVSQGTLAAAGSVRARNVDAPRIGGAADLSGKFDLRGERLGLSEVVITQGSARVAVEGQILMLDQPELELQIRTQEADVRTLLDAVHWRRLLQGTWVVRRLEQAEVATDSRPFAALPDREGASLDPSRGQDFGALYNHWQSHRREPRLADHSEVEAARPFWESLDGLVDAEIRVGGKANDPYLFAQVDVDDAKAYGHSLTKASMLAWYGDDELVVEHLDLVAAEGGTVSVTGSLGKGRALETIANDVDLSWINPWLASNDIVLAGRAGTRIVATGALSRPRLAIIASAQEGQISDFLYDRAIAEAVLEKGMLDIRQCALEKDGKEARMAGSLPVGLRPEETTLDLTLDVRGNGLGIVSVLSKGLVDWKGGDGQLRVDILGTSADPRLRGALKLQGARIAVQTLAGEISDIDADAQIGAGIVKIERASARYGGGVLEANGYLTMKQFKFESYLLDVWAARTKIALKSGLYDGQLEGHVQVGGKVERPSVTGELTVSNGTLHLGAAQQGGDAGPEDTGIPIDVSGLNVAVKETVNVVQQNFLNVRVGGNLIVSGTLAQPDLKGVINVVPGGKITTFYTNQFTIDEGAVEFLGSVRPAEESDLVAELLAEDRRQDQVEVSAPNARVRIVAHGTTVDYDNLHPEPGEVQTTGKDATRKPKTVRIKATITGTLTDLKYAFVSEPPTYTEKEIESLLGKPSLVATALTAVTTRATTSVGVDLVREVAPQAFTFLAKQWIAPLFDSTLGLFLRDYGVDLVSDPAQQEFIKSLNIGVYAETRAVGPFSATYRRDINTSGTKGQRDLKRYGLNLSAPLGLQWAGPSIEWLTPSLAVTDLTLGLVLEDTAGAGEIPTGVDTSLNSTGPVPNGNNDLHLFRDVASDPWRASLQIGIRGRW